MLFVKYMAYGYYTQHYDNIK